MTFELTSLCNWRCKHCYITDYSNRGLEKDKIFEILVELRNQNAFDVIFTGGEVLLREDLLDIVLFARKLGFRVSILSNASLLTEELAKDLSKTYISSFSSTIFSLDENIHDEITSVKGSLNAALRGLAFLKKYGVPVEVKTPILQSNNNSYEKVAEFAEKSGFEYTCSPIIYPTMDGNNSTLKLGMNNKTLAKQIWNIDSLMKYTKNIVKEGGIPCTILQYSIYISPDEDVYPCGSYPHSMGNIKSKTIQEIWNNLEYNKVKDFRFFHTENCCNCDLSEYCNYCPGLSYIENKNPASCSEISKRLAQIRKNVYERGSIDRKQINAN